MEKDYLVKLEVKVKAAEEDFNQAVSRAIKKINQVKPENTEQTNDDISIVMEELD